MPFGATALSVFNVFVLVTALARGTLLQLALAGIVCLVTAGRLLARSRVATRAPHGR